MQSFKEAYNQLNVEQKRAVDAIEGPVLVIAGPGTGKTQLLSTRVANILQSADAQAEPHNILCLTFTESAAYEMRQRLINIIGQKAYNITISTYHAFGSELIRRFPNYFSDSSDTTAIDELGQRTILHSIIDDLSYSNPLKKSEYYLRDVLSSISEAKRALLTPQQLKKIAKANLAFIESTNKITKKELRGIARIDKKSIPKFEQLLAIVKPQASASVPGVVPLAKLFHAQLEEALATVQETGKTSALTRWKNNWLERDREANFVVSGAASNNKLLALADIYNAYRQKLTQQGLYDYDDMILRAIEGLQHNPELRYSLQEQYMYILLDEFQDTNAAQLTLVSLLTDSPVHENKPNILAVGDDDQAIYAFQGADYSHMLAFTDMYKDVQVITLAKNYRSHKDILHTAHNIAEQIETRLHHHLHDVTKLLTAESTSLPKEAQIERHEFKSDVAQFGWVTKQVARLIQAGTPASEIAILAPEHRYLEPMIPYLRQAKVPVRYDKRENVLEDVHIIQLLRMAELVLALHDNNIAIADGLWPEILSYDFWGLDTGTIWELSWQSNDTRTSWTKLLATDTGTKDIALFFARLSNLAELETLETMLDYLIGVSGVSLHKNRPAYHSPFYQYHFGKKQRDDDVSSFWALLSNLTVLRQHLRDYQPPDSMHITLRDLVTFAYDHIRADIKVLNTSPYHESAEAVQVMTAYKAKGMEFAHVFVLAAVDEVWGSKAITQSSKVPLPQNLSFIRYKGASNDERLRLLFVALTRAKHGLYLTSYKTNFAGRPTTHLKYLNEVEDGQHLISQALPSRHQQVQRSEESLPDIEDLAAYWQHRHTQPQTLATLKDILKPRLDRYQMAPTHLNSFIDTMYGGPEHFFLNTILKFPKSPHTSGEFGNAIHETLEWVHIQHQNNHALPAKAAILKTFEQKLAAKKLAPRDTKLLLERGTQALSIYLDQKLHTFNEDDEFEYNFKQQGVFVGPVHLSGKIDRLIIDKKNRTIKIVDFKTGDSHSTWDKNSVKLYKYRQQLYMYKLLIEGSHQFADYTVSDAYLQFIEPDAEGNIVELRVDFTTNEMRRLKILITKTWEHITTLNFPDISSYSADMRGITDFENDLIEGTV